MAVVDEFSGNVTKCLPSESDCEEGYFQSIWHKYRGGPMVGKRVSMV